MVWRVFCVLIYNLYVAYMQHNVVKGCRRALTYICGRIILICMSVHFLKPALRAQDVYEFAKRQKQWLFPYDGRDVFPVRTSRKPKRIEEMIDGGSVYWVVKNQIQCRQKVVGFETIEEEGAKPEYLILCEPQLYRTEAIRRKAFQGWRYLEIDRAPPDKGAIYISDDMPPPELEKILREAGLL